MKSIIFAIISTLVMLYTGSSLALTVINDSGKAVWLSAYKPSQDPHVSDGGNCFNRYIKPNEKVVFNDDVCLSAVQTLIATGNILCAYSGSNMSGIDIRNKTYQISNNKCTEVPFK